MGATFYPQLVVLLRSAGCQFVRQGKGSHEIWHSPITHKISVYRSLSNQNPPLTRFLSKLGLTKSFDNFCQYNLCWVSARHLVP
jgi:hypothetical protein